MDLMRKPLSCLGLLAVLLLSTMCTILHSAVLSAASEPFLPVQQQSSQPAPSPDAGQPPASDDQAPSLSDQVIQDILEPLRTGMETQNIQQVLSLFDKKEFRSYSTLQGQLRAFFQLYSEVRFRYQILQVTADNDHSSATAEMEMDALPYEVTQVSVRRSVQMRLQMKRDPKGWKVVGFTPADFFAMGFNKTDARQ
jgi:hypothetical protein